jgi:hypothetical protein
VAARASPMNWVPQDADTSSSLGARKRYIGRLGKLDGFFRANARSEFRHRSQSVLTRLWSWHTQWIRRTDIIGSPNALGAREITNVWKEPNAGLAAGCS